MSTRSTRSSRSSKVEAKGIERMRDVAEASTLLDLELLVRLVDISQGLTNHPNKVTVTLLVVVHKRITDELGDLRPKL